jgi:mercuric ion binding protein
MNKLLTLTTYFLTATTAFAGEATTSLDVKGLTCPSCSFIVATALKRVETVEIVNFTEGTAEDGTYLLRFDDAVTTPKALVAAVTGVGYDATLNTEGGS